MQCSGNQESPAFRHGECQLSLPYKLEIIPDKEEGGYTARYPELPGCLTYGETLESVTANAADAKKVWLKAALEDGLAINEPSMRA